MKTPPSWTSRVTRLFSLALCLAAPALRAADAPDPLLRRSAHPYLTYSDANIAKLKDRVQREPSMAEAWNQMLATANRALEQTGARGGRGGGPGGGNELLCLAYRMTGDKKFGERVKQNLLAQNLGGRDDALLMLRDPPWH
jgi:oligo-alginate lyase